MKVKEKANPKAKLKAKVRVRARVRASTEVIPADYNMYNKKNTQAEHITIEVCPKCVA
jgi:hypothetical protein